MPWLLREGDVLAAVDERRPGWRTDFQGAVILNRLAVLHTLTGSAALDVARCSGVTGPDGQRLLEVRRTATLPPRRVARPLLGSSVLVVAAAGAFERWDLRVGDRLEVR